MGTSKIRLSRDGPKFLLIVLRVMTIFSPLRVFLPVAATFVRARRRRMASGISSRTATSQTASVLLIMLSVVVLLIGLVSEQISALRFDGRK